jgi:CBS domain-containing protein
MSLRETLGEPVSNYMFREFASVGADDTVTAAARKMRDASATEALVLSGGSPMGIITERDILYKVVAAGSNPSTMKVKEVMSSPVQTIEETAKVGDAIAKMSKLGIRRLGVTSGGKVVGMVTQKAMVDGDTQHVPLPELSRPNGYVCPYCNAVVNTREELSKHIDRNHMGGMGLLQGDLSKW